MRDQILQKDISLDWYPHLKEGISDIFNTSISLVHLARQLERDFVIYEKEPNAFRLSFKKAVLKLNKGDITSDHSEFNKMVNELEDDDLAGIETT